MSKPQQNLNQYNKIFETLCSDGDQLDIFDMVAYSLYKKAKKEFVKNIKVQYSRKPTQSELNNYVSSAELHLENYKSQAERMVGDLFNNILNEKYPEIENQVLKEYNKNNFWYDVFIGLFTSFLWSVILVVMYFIISGYSIEEVGKQYFNKHKIEDKTNPK
jgi:hypothetical protein